MAEQKNNPLHGVSLETILNRLVDHFGWQLLGKLIQINCFIENPSIQSSLKFLRKTPWARKKVEDLYRKYIQLKNKTPGIQDLTCFQKKIFFQLTDFKSDAPSSGITDPAEPAYPAEHKKSLTEITMKDFSFNMSETSN